MKKRLFFAFTIAELTVIIIIIGVLFFVMLGFVNRNQQNEFDAKINKTSVNLSQIVNKALVQKTGQSEFRYTPQTIYDELIRNQNVLNCTDGGACAPCVDCWSNTTVFDLGDGNTEDVARNDKILLTDETVIAFGQQNIYIDSNGIKGPNKFGQDIQKWNGIYGRPAFRGTSAICSYPRVLHGTLCCNPKGANQVWVAADSCAICTRVRKPNDSTWKPEEGGDPCNWDCTNEALHKNDSKWELPHLTCEWQCSSNRVAQGYDSDKEKITNIVITSPTVDNGCKYSYDCLAPNHINRTTACCSKEPKGNNQKWKYTTGCDICYKNSDEEWYGTECGTCSISNYRGSSCCSEMPDGYNKRWKYATGCELCNRPAMYTYAQWKNDSYGCDTECKGDRPYKNDESKWCCPTKPSKPDNSHWLSNDGCKWDCNGGYEKYDNNTKCRKIINCRDFNGKDNDVNVGKCRCCAHQGSDGYNGSIKAIADKHTCCADGGKSRGPCTAKDGTKYDNKTNAENGCKKTCGLSGKIKFGGGHAYLYDCSGSYY